MSLDVDMKELAQKALYHPDFPYGFFAAYGVARKAFLCLIRQKNNRVNAKLLESKRYNILLCVNPAYDAELH